MLEDRGACRQIGGADLDKNSIATQNFLNNDDNCVEAEWRSETEWRGNCVEAKWRRRLSGDKLGEDGWSGEKLGEDGWSGEKLGENE